MLASIINLAGPDRYIHYSFFSISLANLIIILIMALIFGLALILPFPKPKIIPVEEDPKSKFKLESGQTIDSQLQRQWTYRLRHLWLKKLPPEQLLPDSQPIYVASWIYVFGVATLVALLFVVLSGVVLAVGGISWWHDSQLGHFVNSLHLWSVEVFMSLMVIHLWGKFWMSAWRGKRALTWMTGVLAFVVSITEAFTGYLSQQNFDSQWIATNAKDAVNSTGLGSFFNVMNFGQIITWHIVIIPIFLVLMVGLHIVLVRLKGVVPPVQRPKSAAAKLALKHHESATYQGPKRQYDILKEGTVAFVVVGCLIFGLAYLLSSPDQPAVTVQSWARLAPKDFVATADSELAGTSKTASYGPPYNNQKLDVQRLGVSWQLLAGVRQPINAAQTFVITPLQANAGGSPQLIKALNQYNQASLSQRQFWAKTYASHLNQTIKFTNSHLVTNFITSSDYGPIPTLLEFEYRLALSGAIDANLIAQKPFYGTNYTKPLLFIEDGNYFSSIATKENLTGNQWGVMNEGGSYPGQPWLWLYTLWYQVPGFRSSTNVDLIAIYLTTLATLTLLLVPFIPGLRSVPLKLPIYKLIWRNSSTKK